MQAINVIGAGLAGSECALQLASLGHTVELFEMRPNVMTPVHKTAYCAELVCSNSLKSTRMNCAQGVLKKELSLIGSRLLEIAEDHKVPAGNALAVDREAFAQAVTCELNNQSLIQIHHEEVRSLPKGPTVIATGPVTSEAFVRVLSDFLGNQAENLAFYDAVAPIVDAESLNMDEMIKQSRYQKEGETSDYLNAFMDKKRYVTFVTELIHAKKATLHDFERHELFSACQPLEEIARTGEDALRFGPLKPKGLINPKTQKQPYAAVQLRAENTQQNAYNLVGFQTNLTFSEQKRIFSLIPGLEYADYFRYGVLHKNTFINAPKLTKMHFQSNKRPNLFFAGQIIGTEGYVEAIAGGLVAAKALHAYMCQKTLSPLPSTTVLGSLLAYATNPATTHYQPMHVNYGLLPPLAKKLSKRKRYEAYGMRALEDLRTFLDITPGWRRPQNV